MGGSSKSSTSSSTNTETNNASNESGLQIVDSNGASIVMTDYDAIKLSFGAIENIVSDAIESVDSSNERIQQINNDTVGTLKDFAENLKVGDLKITKTVFLVGAGSVGLMALAVVYVSNKKKSSVK
tara:strand:- start:155 stop:532 length:378 start_codon:yes stop_codon:yes gene_type:complete